MASQMIEPHDDDVLCLLKDIQLVHIPVADQTRSAYRLDFVFGENVFFDNEVLIFMMSLGCVAYLSQVHALQLSSRLDCSLLF
jgi:hypothetical protein